MAGSLLVIAVCGPLFFYWLYWSLRLARSEPPRPSPPKDLLAFLTA